MKQDQKLEGGGLVAILKVTTKGGKYAEKKLIFRNDCGDEIVTRENPKAEIGYYEFKWNNASAIIP